MSSCFCSLGLAAARSCLALVPVVMPHPFHGVLEMILVPAFGRQIEDAVRCPHHLNPAAINRIGVESCASGGPVIDADPWGFRAAEGLHGVIVIHFSTRHLSLGEGHGEVVIELAAVGGNPLEPPSHPLL